MVRATTLAKWKTEQPERYKAYSIKKAAWRKQWSKKNKERENATRKAWRENNKEKISARVRQWEKNHPEKLRESQALWRQRHPEAWRAYQRNRLKNPRHYWQGRYCTLKTNAAKRHIAVSITFEDMYAMEGRACYL